MRHPLVQVGVSALGRPNCLASATGDPLMGQGGPLGPVNTKYTSAITLYEASLSRYYFMNHSLTISNNSSMVFPESNYFLKNR